MAKSISGSVGKGGKNRPEDVIVVQYLLNCVPSKQGGPAQELILDGLSGPKTCAAIQRFQSAALGFADSRVDPGGQTFTALLNYDPYPNQKLTLPASSAGAKGGKVGGTPSTNSWDPWGYNNPAGDNYQKDGKQPGTKFGGDSSPQESAGKQGSGWKEPFGGKGGSQSGAAKGGGYPPPGTKGGSQAGSAKGGGYTPPGSKGGMPGTGGAGGGSGTGAKGGSMGPTVINNGAKGEGKGPTTMGNEGGIVGKF